MGSIKEDVEKESPLRSRRSFFLDIPLQKLLDPVAARFELYAWSRQRQATRECFDIVLSRETEFLPGVLRGRRSA
jgi:hypothetical protein